MSNYYEKMRGFTPTISLGSLFDQLRAKYNPKYSRNGSGGGGSSPGSGTPTPNPAAQPLNWTFPQYSQTWAFTPPAPTPYLPPPAFDPKNSATGYATPPKTTLSGLLSKYGQ